MLLDSICNSKVYHQNAFYLLGLQVGMSRRRLKHRIEDLQGAGEMGISDWHHAYDQFLIGSAEAPERDVFDDLADRIKDPEFFITEAFFWFWPINDCNDPAMEAICSGDRETACNIWHGLSVKSTVDAVIARHNLAVLFHYYAIDGENQRLSGVASTENNTFLNILDQFWRTSFGYWEKLIDDDDFWDAFAERVKAVDDPRLDSDFVEEFRTQFPISFDNINADYLVEYARIGKLEDAKRHFEYMTETMSESDDVEETLNSAFKPQIDKLHILIRHCRESKNAEEGLENIQAVLDGSKDLFQIFRFLLPKDNRMSKDLMNEVVKVCHDRLPAYANKTNDYDNALLIERQLLTLVSSPTLKDSIQNAIATLDEIIKNRREADTCLYCKTYQKDTPKKTVKMYGELLPAPSKFGRVTYSTIEIKVPVCKNCSHRFSNASVESFPAINQRLKTGWKFGTTPTDAEVNAVWNDIADILQGAFRR